jgi:hypothetical protein
LTEIIDVVARASGLSEDGVRDRYTLEQVMLKYYFAKREKYMHEERLAKLSAAYFGEILVKVLEDAFS